MALERKKKKKNHRMFSIVPPTGQHKNAIETIKTGLKWQREERGRRPTWRRSGQKFKIGKV